MRWVKLSDVIVRANTKVDKDNTDLVYYVGGEHFESGELMVDQKGIIAGSTIGPMFYYGFKAGQFLLVSRNPHLKKAGIVEFDGICSEKTFVLQSADENVLLPEYLPFVLQNDCFWKYAVDHKHGSTNFFINWSTLANYEFPLPSIEVQKDISEVAWAAYELKKKYKNLLESTDNLVKSQFIEMFGDPISNSQNRPTVRLDSVVTLQRGFDLPTSKRNENGSIPIFGSNGLLGYHDTSMAKDGVVTGRSGTIGQVYCVHGDYWPLNTSLFSIDTHGNNIDYLAYLLRYFDLTRFYNGTGVPTLNRNDVHRELIYDIPRDEQEHFVTFAKQSDKSKFELKESIKKMDGLIKSLIQNENQ